MYLSYVLLIMRGHIAWLLTTRQLLEVLKPGLIDGQEN